MSNEMISKEQMGAHAREEPFEALFLIFLMTLCATHGGVMTGVRICAFVMASLGLIVSKLPESYKYWTGLSWVLAMNLVLNHDQSANHYWLTVYATAYFALKWYSKFLGEQIFLNIPRALLLVVFGFATVQKVFSPYFLSGRLLGGYILGGNVFYNIFEIFFGDAYRDSVKSYTEALNFSSSDLPLEKYWADITLPYPEFHVHCFYAAVLVIAFELVVFLVLLSNRTFHSRVANWTMMIFVWGTFAFRGEFTFFSLVCILFMEAKGNLSKRWRAAYLVTVLLFLAFEVSDVK